MATPMATQLVTSPTAGEAVTLDRAGVAEVLAPTRSFGATEAIAIEERPSARVVWRESLHRRSLGAADLIAATLTVAFVLRPFARHQIALAAPAAGAVLLVLFKIAGLYDRDDLRLVHSTLDEIPLLAQLTGLFAICIGLLETELLNRDLSVERVGLLWLLAFSAVVVGRLAARALADRASPPERCIVIGEPSLAERLRQKIASSHARAEVVASLALGDAGNIDGRGMAGHRRGDARPGREPERSPNHHRPDDK